ncbi:MAG: T9SS type A sorting domain-containing protein [Candidatus Cloacimonadota bacterium]|nr:T9SS type A sorting domain-containing protein [Candidatus Cloacimonadota bacterium]
MKRFYLMFLLLLMCGVLFAELEGYPKTILAENFTSGCANCTDSYSGLDVVHNQYDRTEFNSVRYYPQSHPLGNEETNAIYSLYGISYTPFVIFDGVHEYGGGGSVIATGEPYLEIVEDIYFQDSPIKMQIDTFDPQTGDIRVYVQMISSNYDITEQTIRLLLLEDDVISFDTHVTRDIIKDSITLQEQGEATIFQHSFKIDTEWETENLQAVAYVQSDGFDIIQSTSTYPTPQYKVRGWVPFDLIQTSGSSGSYTSENFGIVNFGEDLEVTAELIVDSAPVDWQIYLCDEENTYTQPVTFNLNEQDSKIFYYSIESSSSANAEFHLKISSENLEEHYEIPFTFAVNTSYETQTVSPSYLVYNYPNPFNPSTTIFFNEFSRNKPVEIEIFNTKGQLINSFIENDRNWTEWDGQDSSGNPVSSGIYLYKVKTENKQATGKMMLIK